MSQFKITSKAYFQLPRSLELSPGGNMGGLKGVGGQDYKKDHETQQVTTTAAFEDFQFSVNAYP